MNVHRKHQKKKLRYMLRYLMFFLGSPLFITAREMRVNLFDSLHPYHYNVFVYKYLIVLFFPSILLSEPLNLICKGEAEIIDSAQVSSFGSSSSYGTTTGSTSSSGSGSATIVGRKTTNTAISLYFDESFANGYIKLPVIMRPAIGGRKIDKWDLKDIEVNDEEIKARFRINFANKPKISISRVTGRIEYKAIETFSGDCEVVKVSEKKF